MAARVGELPTRHATAVRPAEAGDPLAFEQALVERRLAVIERHARTILEAMNCPTDPVRIYAILKREARAPWPARTAARDSRRATRALFMLRLVDMARADLEPGAWRPLRAVCYALDAAAVAAESLVDLATSRRQRQAGQRRAAQRGMTPDEAAALREQHAWLRAAWPEASDAFVVGCLARRLGMSPRTIRRRLKKLGQ